MRFMVVLFRRKLVSWRIRTSALDSQMPISSSPQKLTAMLRAGLVPHRVCAPASFPGSEVLWFFMRLKAYAGKPCALAGGLTVGCFPPSEVFPAHRLGTCESWSKRRARKRTAIWRVGLTRGHLNAALDDSRKRPTPAAFPKRSAITTWLRFSG